MLVIVLCYCLYAVLLLLCCTVIALLCYYLCCPMYWLCVLYHCHRVLTQLQLTNMSISRTRPPWWPSCGVFPSKCSSTAPAKKSNTLRWYFGLWKIMKRMPSWSQIKVELIYLYRVFDFIACLHSPPPPASHDILSKSPEQNAATRILWLLLLLLLLCSLPASDGLRHYVTRWEVPGSIPGSDIRNVQVFYSHSVVLGSSQPLTEMCIKAFTSG